MINTTNTVSIDGEVIGKREFLNAFQYSSNDRFGRWVLRPLAAVATVAVGLAVLFASSILFLLSLALLPLLAILAWAVKKKLEQEEDPVVACDGDVQKAV